MQNFLYELTLSIPMEHVEVASEALIELGALSVAVEDADADSENEKPIFGEPNMPQPSASSAWEKSLLKALFAKESESVEAATLLMAQPWGEQIHVQTVDKVAEQDWVRLTQSQFDPIEVTPEFWIVPSWHKAPEQAQKIIALDPGMAFGTGTHATTHMCLHWIAKHNQMLAKQRVLDYGCGSGILAIASAIYEAATVDAVDIDAAAVEASQYNAQMNHVMLNIGLPEMAQGEYDVVLANILATPLKLLAPLLCAHVKKGGALVLAGILDWQAKELEEAYAPWLKLTISNSKDGWILMTGIK